MTNSLALLHGAETISLVLAVIGIGVWLGVRYLRYAEFSELQDIVQRAMQRKRIRINNVTLRRVTESLDACADLRTIFRILKDTLQPLGFDGFQFTGLSLDRIPESFLTPLSRDPSRGLRCCWVSLETSDPAWELKLELMTSSGHKWGHFSLFRTSVEQPLLLDINLLNGGFRAALSDALQRAMSRVQEAARDQQRVETSWDAQVAPALSPR